MKKLLKFIFSSGITLTLWFYFDNLTDKLKAILFPKKTILQEIYKETLDIKDESKIEMIKEIKKDNTWLDSLDYVFWGDQNFKERLKTEGIWKTLWQPYVKSDNSTAVPINTKSLSTHDAVVKTDEQIKDTAIESANHIHKVLSNYFQNNMSWIDYLIIQGFKLLLILIFFFLIYLFITFFFKWISKKD